MARIRTIKPEFFRHEGLQDLEAANPGAYTMLVFAGLWGHCDKAGTFEWKPRVLKLDILPFLSFDMAATLNLLEEAGLIVRFEVEGKLYGKIPSFADHQRISGKEAESPVKYPGSTGEAPGKHMGLQEGKGREREREKEGEGNGDAQARAPDGLDLDSWNRWEGYRREIRKPLKPASIPAAQRALAAFGSDQAAVVEQSVAHGWQGLFALKSANGRVVAAEPVRTWRPEPGDDETAEPQRARY